MKIGYLGPEGTFTEQAVIEYANLVKSKFCNIETICYNKIESAISALKNEKTDKAVIPVENSTEGAVNAAIDSIIFEGNIFIESMAVLPVVQNMFVAKGFCSQVEKIISHPQALAQCGNFINTNYGNSQLIAAASTAEAAKIVSESGGGIAAIGNKRAAELYGLDILHENIHDDPQNCTSFAVLTKGNIAPPCAGHRTSIAFSTQNKPGELYKILDIFALWGLNMTKIQSRPFKKRHGEYVFYIDVEGYTDASDVKDALKMVKRKAAFFKNLGTYSVNIIENWPKLV